MLVEMINIGFLENHNSTYMFAIVYKPVHTIQCMYEMDTRGSTTPLLNNFYAISLKLWSQKQND